MNTPVSHLPDWSYSFFQGLGESVRRKTLKKTQIVTGNQSIWFPHGELGFGGHYSPTSLHTKLESMSDTELVELGKKSFQLKGTIGAIIVTILIAGGGYYAMNQDTPVEKSPTSQIKN